MSVVLLDTYFNPRSPRGERLAKVANGGVHTVISIHAPREGSDNDDRPGFGGGPENFNPRSPRGERLAPGLMELADA